ncbi:hypothetical protein N8310_04490 [Pseudomonadota bacterium]|jgi:uncharacterized membrane protein|nr:hypothetical protein [Alphaproteobacteria bacterium]MDC1356826.1 hypothetical protein [Pseudomonadota bacterium]|tara:strand:+ start:129 stop:710 length:582 start_codon:yes stop_codon:yes gene_type:complete
MSIILTNLRNTIIVGFILAFILIFALAQGSFDQTAFNMWLLRWFHVLSAIMWVGILYYFNFIQIPNMGKIPDEQKPAISKVIAPAALWWFRWGSVATVVTGLILAHLNGYLHKAMTFSDVFWPIGVGMWLGLIMFLNVWGVIWPSQKRALGIIEVDADTKAKAARKAMLFSRINTMLSIPMLVAMTVQQNTFS